MIVVVGAAVPVAVCRWGLCSRCPVVGEVSLGGILIISSGKRGGGGNARCEISLYTILSCRISYYVWHKHGGSEGGSNIAQWYCKSNVTV